MIIRAFVDAFKASYSARIRGNMFDDMLGKVLNGVNLTDDKSEVHFVFADGSVRSFGVEGDCCSNSWIEHLEMLNDVMGSVIMSVNDSDCVESDSPDYECLKVYHTQFRTNRGDIILEYRNSSNGYYGGYLVDRGWL